MAAQFPNWQKQERIQTRRAGLILGIALSMLFDGIVFHQLLQWHHMASNVMPVAGLELQTFWDGLFHASAYLLLVIGILLLWRLATQIEPGKVRKPLFGYVLVGFGAFNIAESIVNHWVLRLHHVREGVELWWVYDAVFFLIAGVLVAAAGMYVIRSKKLLMPKQR